MDADLIENGRPAKRARVDQLDGAEEREDVAINNTLPAPVVGGGETSVVAATQSEDEQIQKEARAGITAYIRPDEAGFSGILKQRYTDFLVNEILPNGQVVHLTNLFPAKRQQAGKAKTAPAKAPVVEPAVSTDKAEEQNPNGSEDSANKKEAEPQQPKNISEDDQKILGEIFGEDRIKLILNLYEQVIKHPTRKPREFQPVVSDVIQTKDTRTRAHMEIRRIFESRFETTTGDDETIKITPAPVQVKGRGGAQGQGGRAQGGPNGMRGNLGWQDLGGEYLHFTLYKENKDTMEAIFFIATQLRVNMKALQFGGTKDRRGVTVQRVSAYRIHAEQVAGLNKRLRGSKVGDFSYHPKGLELGDLGGNEFCITLRDCRFPGDDAMDVPSRVKAANAILTKSVADFQTGGFINYYGLQRFGSFAAGTDAIGTKLLQGNLGGAIDDILSFSPAALAASQLPDDDSSTSASAPSGTLISSDDKNRAAAINIWRTTHDISAALARLPRKFSAEANIMRHLGARGQNRASDFQGALMTIPRALRLMYVHAYQSLVWNVVAGHRWETYGARVAAGDLVLINEHRDKIDSATAAADNAEIDDQGEVIVRPAASDRAAAESDYEQARALSAEEAASGLYTVFDVVLPLPGYDVVYPPNEVGNMYKTFMNSERGGGLNPLDMRRGWKDISLSGGYRKLLGRPGPGMQFELKTYADDLEQLVETDLQRLEKSGGNDAADAINAAATTTTTASVSAGDKSKIAVILRMRLAPSMYATMALRELMKSGGVKTYKPDYGGGR